MEAPAPPRLKVPQGHFLKKRIGVRDWYLSTLHVAVTKHTRPSALKELKTAWFTVSRDFRLKLLLRPLLWDCDGM